MTVIRVAHSPDSDDAFMFYALANGLIDTGDLEFEHVLDDIEALNREAFSGTYEVTAVSIHAYAHLDHDYALLGSGASMGDGYGPVVVAREEMTPRKLATARVAIPGTLTSAALVLKMWNPGLETKVMRFDAIGPAVRLGDVEAGVLIHEGQLTWKGQGLVQVVDLGKWWSDITGGLPLPLGGNVIRRDLGRLIPQVSKILRQSIAYSLEHRQEALDYALGYGRSLGRDQVDRFVGMYVNELTLDYGERGRRAVHELLQRAHKLHMIPKVPRLEFV
jgi:1,4-dihydroxy-6-naphthoate synthase